MKLHLTKHPPRPRRQRPTYHYIPNSYWGYRSDGAAIFRLTLNPRIHFNSNTYYIPPRP